ncbi:MAG: glutathione S-transferase family protein [Methyloligella sp. ZOD6]
MQATADTPIEITAFSWVPDFARGFVRDLRPRWALEELGLPYRTRLIDSRGPRPAEYYREQPFGQVPALRDDGVSLFESGAILIHLGEKDEKLLPRDPAERARAIVWTFAALNSIEPTISELAAIDIFYPGEEWASLRRPGAEDAARSKLSRLADWLGDKQWLEDRFTIGDLTMVTVLRDLDHTDLLAEFPSLTAYCERGTARPAFERAYRAQLSDLEDEARPSTDSSHVRGETA